MEAAGPATGEDPEKEGGLATGEARTAPGMGEAEAPWRRAPALGALRREAAPRGFSHRTAGPAAGPPPGGEPPQAGASRPPS